MPLLPFRSVLTRATLLGSVVVSAACSSSKGPPGQDDAAVFAAMDSIYARFTRAYARGEPDSVLILYSNRPLYLPGQGPVLEGRDALASQFTFLRTLRERGATPRIEFESVGRGTSGELAWDAGYYTIRVEQADGSLAPPNRGKFTTVWTRDPRGEWRIHVDGFSPAPPPPEGARGPAAPAVEGE